MKEPVVIIIPFYKDTVTEYERIALEQCFKVLSKYPIIAIKPNRLILPAEVGQFPFSGTISFNDHFFEGIAGYNRLMLSKTFYEAFLNYELMLIYQTDAFVFEDKLDYWCRQRFDYIGAPWLKDCEHPDIVKAVKSTIQYYFHTRYNVYKNGEPSKYQWENRVGNGGFSLRRVAKFHSLCIQKKAEIEFYLKQNTHHYNEDSFWSIAVNRKQKVLNIPNYKVGLKFAFEFAPERGLKLNNGSLPFGCHGWERQLNFWRPIFQNIGYEV